MLFIWFEKIIKEMLYSDITPVTSLHCFSTVFGCIGLQMFLQNVSTTVNVLKNKVKQ